MRSSGLCPQIAGSCCPTALGELIRSARCSARTSPGAEHTEQRRPRKGPGMELSPSAHVDTFCRDNLPPPEEWPTLLVDLPELRYPQRLNCAAALLDDVAAAHGPDRPCLRTDAGTWSYGELLA